MKKFLLFNLLFVLALTFGSIDANAQILTPTLSTTPATQVIFGDSNSQQVTAKVTGLPSTIGILPTWSAWVEGQQADSFMVTVQQPTTLEGEVIIIIIFFGTEPLASGNTLVIENEVLNLLMDARTTLPIEP